MASSQSASPPDRLSPSEWQSAQRFLLEHLRADTPTVADTRPNDAQWAVIAAEAKRHRVHTVAYRRLCARLGAETIPEDIAADLRELYRLGALRNAALFRETAAVTSALASRGIATIMLKGLHLASQVYDEPSMRSMADLDLMVPRGQLTAAERVLADIGYSVPTRPHVDTVCAEFSHLERLVKGGSTVVELHHTIELPTSPFRIDPATLWNSSLPAEIAGAKVRVLSSEHLLVHLCIHLAWHHTFTRAGLKTMLDVATLTHARAADMDWSLVMETARTWGAEAFAYCVLRMSRDVVGADVPPGVLQALSHDSVDDEVAEAAARAILSPPLEQDAARDAMPFRDGILRRARLMTSGAVPPVAQLRREYGRRVSESSLRLYPRRFVDVFRRRGPTMLRVGLGRQPMRPVAQHLLDRGRIVRWVEDRSRAARRCVAGGRQAFSRIPITHDQ